MLFTSLIFLGAFLPATLFVYGLLVRFAGHRLTLAWIVLSSLFFYGWWEPRYLAVIIVSIVFNHAAVSILPRIPSARKRSALAVAIVVNLVLLGLFKYSGFIMENFNFLTGSKFPIPDIMLPLAISFFTFQQISYVIDAYKGQILPQGILKHAACVVFFPQLIAGPIVRYRDLMPQIIRACLSPPLINSFSPAITLFLIGFFKKVVIADGVAAYATPVFNAAERGASLTLLEGWGGALAYTFQLYFDFSGYCDMAMALALLFGIRLPLNFFSPYQSTSIIEFWRRWHITLSHFLRDYVYIPLGGNKNGRRYANLLVTMLLGGIWHGAGWTFVIWGALHGAYLAINHAWRSVIGEGWTSHSRFTTYLGTVIAWILTFGSVVLAWVFFRAESFDSAILILKSMFGLGPYGFSLATGRRYDGIIQTTVLLCLLIITFAPNSMQILRRYRPASGASGSYPKYWLSPKKITSLHPSLIRIVLLILLFLWGLTVNNRTASEFLYFNF